MSQTFIYGANVKDKACECWACEGCTSLVPIGTGPEQRACSSWCMVVWH